MCLRASCLKCVAEESCLPHGEKEPKKEPGKTLSQALSGLLPTARSYLIKCPESPAMLLLVGSSPAAHELMGSFHSKLIPEVLVILKVEISVPGNTDLVNRKLAFKADFSSC